MKFIVKTTFCCFAIFAAFFAEAQQTSPNIAYVYPAGGQRGSTFKAIIGGRNFTGAERVIVTGGGVSVKVKEITVPAQQNDVPALLNKLEKEYILLHPEVKEEVQKLGNEGQAFLRKKIRSSPENVEAIAAVEASYFLRRLSGDAMAETVEVEITIDESADVSERNIMVLTPQGLSNPVKFMVGALPEVAEDSLREVARERASFKKNKGRWLHVYTQVLSYVLPSKKTETHVDLPVVANGQITEANTDTYSFDAKKGQKIVFSVQAQTLIPYISDAVPGWFQPVIIVRNSKGEEMAYNDDFYHHPDSLLLFEVPADGKYSVEIYDAIYRSREDFVYRLTIGEIPFVTGIFPLGGKTGSVDNFELSGYNLEAGTIQINMEDAGISTKYAENSLKDTAHMRLPMMVSSVDEIVSAAETEKLRNGGTLDGVDVNSLKPAELKIPNFANGRIVKKGQVDSYKFELEKGKKAVIEIFARRLGSPLDSFITVSDEGGKVLAQSDDVEDFSYGLVTHHADSRLEFTSPKSGSYVIRVYDASGTASELHAYRLYIGEPAEDFELRTVPANINIAPGDSTVFNVHLFRKNGFDSPVILSAKNLPQGWTLSGGVIGKGKDSARVTLTAPESEQRKIFPIQIVGNAVIGGKNVSRVSIPCEDMMQAFYYRHYVPAAQQNVCVNTAKIFGKRYDSLKFETDYLDKTLQIPIEGGKTFKIGRLNRKVAGNVKCNIESENGNLKVSKFYVSGNRMYVIINADPEKSKVGEMGRFILSFIAKKGRDFVQIASMPSWEYRIVAKQLNADKSPDEPPPPPPPEENNKKPKKKGGKKPSAVKPDGKSAAATEKNASETQKNAVSSTKKELPQTPKTPRKAKSEDQ